jgi:hypothetical protein
VKDVMNQKKSLYIKMNIQAIIEIVHQKKPYIIIIYLKIKTIAQLIVAQAIERNN